MLNSHRSFMTLSDPHLARRRPNVSSTLTRPWWVGAVGAIASIFALSGCPRAGDTHTSTTARTQSRQPTEQPLRVGNQVGGVRDQPDYDVQAQDMKQRVDAILPSPLPPMSTACRDMLDVAIAFYTRHEGSDAPAVSMLQATRQRDQHACEAELSSAAAVCVASQMPTSATSALFGPRREDEFAWLLDQCARAYPR